MERQDNKEIPSNESFKSISKQGCRGFKQNLFQFVKMAFEKRISCDTDVYIC